MSYEFSWHKDLLTAVQSIAASLEKLADAPPAAVPASAPTAQPPTAPPVQETVVDYDALAERNNKEDRDVLLALCEKRGIEVPARTKTPTLAKMLGEWDTVNGVTCSAPAETPQPQPEPSTEAKPTEEPDPFADPPAEASTPDPLPADTPVTKEEVLAALQKVQSDASKGTAKVIQILNAAAGVNAWGPLKDAEDGPELQAKLKAVLKAAQEA